MDFDRNIVRFLLLAACCGTAWAQTDPELAALQAQKALLDAQAGIEEAKAKLAKAKQEQIKASREDVTEAELAKAKAEAEKSALLAKLPPTEAKALAGTFGVEGVKLLALPPIITKLDQEAKTLCDKVTGPLLPYDKTIVDGMMGAVVLKDQLEKLIKAYEEWEKVRERPDAQRSPGLLLALGFVTGGVKAAADLAALFKTNISTGKVDLTEAKALFLTMMAGHCGEKFAYVPGGYLGELELTAYKQLTMLANTLLEKRYAMEHVAEQKKAELTDGKVAEKEQQQRIEALKKKGNAATKDEKEELESLLGTFVQRSEENKALAKVVASLEDLVKQTDVFLAGLKLNDPSGSGPLLGAARYLALSKLAADAIQVLDLDVRAEGVTVLKDNLFTGQRLRIGGAAVLGYRIMSKTGAVELAKVVPLSTELIELDLRK